MSEMTLIRIVHTTFVHSCSGIIKLTQGEHWIPKWMMALPNAGRPRRSRDPARPGKPHGWYQYEECKAVMPAGVGFPPSATAGPMLHDYVIAFEGSLPIEFTVDSVPSTVYYEIHKDYIIFRGQVQKGMNTITITAKNCRRRYSTTFTATYLGT